MPTSLDPMRFMSPTVAGSLLSDEPTRSTPGDYPKFGMTMRFKVIVHALKDNHDLGRWSSCKGLKVTFNTTPVKEGGDYTTSRFLPERVEYGRITLERAMSKGDSAKVLAWLRDVQEKWMTPVQRQMKLDDMTIILFDAGGNDVMTWTLDGVCPVSWSCSPFATGQGGIAVETLELQHQGFL